MSTRPKLLFLIADGMGDWPHEGIGDKTPLAAAHTPHMDELARTGMLGRCQTIPEGMAPGSDTANMSLMGFDPATHHTGRGPIEAAAQGLTLGEDDLIWRLNLVTVSEFSDTGLMRDYSSGHITTEMSAPLIQRLQDSLGGQFTFFPGVQYRHILVQQGGANTPDAKLFVHPPHDILDKPIKPDMAAFKSSPGLWELISAAAQNLETDNPSKANSIWPWGQGRPLTLPDFSETYGFKGAVISAVDLIKGLGRAAGMEVIDVQGATGLIDTNYEGKVQAALDFLKKGDFVFVHLEGPDECGHGGDPAEKMEAVARFDARVVGPLRQALAGENVAWVVACDHYTPCVERTHTIDPVPFILNGPGVKASGVTTFTEDTADEAGLMIEKGHDLMRFVLKELGAA